MFSPSKKWPQIQREQVPDITLDSAIDNLMRDWEWGEPEETIGLVKIYKKEIQGVTHYITTLITDDNFEENQNAVFNYLRDQDAFSSPNVQVMIPMGQSGKYADTTWNNGVRKGFEWFNKNNEPLKTEKKHYVCVAIHNGKMRTIDSRKRYLDYEDRMYNVARAYELSYDPNRDYLISGNQVLFDDKNCGRFTFLNIKRFAAGLFSPRVFFGEDRKRAKAELRRKVTVAHFADIKHLDDQEKRLNAEKEAQLYSRGKHNELSNAIGGDDDEIADFIDVQDVNNDDGDEQEIVASLSDAEPYLAPTFESISIMNNSDNTKQEILKEIKNYLELPVNREPKNLLKLCRWLQSKDNPLRAERGFFSLFGGYGNTTSYQKAMSMLKSAAIQYAKLACKQDIEKNNAGILGILNKETGRVSSMFGTASSQAYDELKREQIVPRTKAEDEAHAHRNQVLRTQARFHR